MSKLSCNIFKKRWFPVIALITSYAFLFGVFMLTTRVFPPFNCIENINNTLSIWLCAIAAVCTILPVVLGIKQNMEMDRQERRTEKRFQDLEKSLEKEIQSKLDINKKTIDEFDRQCLRHSLSSIIMQVDTLCDLQDFQYKGSPGLAEKNFTKRLLKALDESAKQANSIFCAIQENLDDHAREEIMGAVLSALSSVRHLAIEYLPLASTPKAKFDVQGVDDRISLCLRDRTLTSDVTESFRAIGNCEGERSMAENLNLRDALYELVTATGMLRASVFRD